MSKLTEVCVNLLANITNEFIENDPGVVTFLWSPKPPSSKLVQCNCVGVKDGCILSCTCQECNCEMLTCVLQFCTECVFH